jgi:GNAT superfamily N-acetyltransferase
LAKAARTKQVLPEHLADPNSALRQYMATQGDSVAGWVRSVTVGEGAWVSNLYVQPDRRRRGLGAALMARMLLDDAAAGVGTSVLLASTAGAMLYPHLGYEKIGELMIFVPPRGKN